jgi:hypothetical protein
MEKKDMITNLTYGPLIVKLLNENVVLSCTRDS